MARRKLIDAARRRRASEEAAPTLALLADELDDAGGEAGVPDERLRLMFACAHPAIDAGVRALMLHAEARREARRDAQGEFVPLDAQDPARWDAALIDEAEALLLSASRMGAPGRFQLEAAVQSAHAARRLNGRTNWAAIVELYDALLALTGSVVVAINRAVALAAHLNGPRGAAEGLAALDALKDDAQLAEYQPYWAARAALLARTGSAQAAAEAYRRAIGLESDPAVRRFLQAELRSASAERSRDP